MQISKCNLMFDQFYIYSDSVLFDQTISKKEPWRMNLILRVKIC